MIASAPDPYKLSLYREASMAEQISIRGLIERIQQGTIRIPKFQRAFVWEAENVAFLMDSIYRGYPIGSVLLWRTEEKLSAERELGTFVIPEPQKKWPVDYVLDGQQRVTSLFGVFQTTLTPQSNEKRFEVYFDLAAKEGALEDQFVAWQTSEPVPESYFPLRLLLDPTPFAKRTRNLSDEQLEIITNLQRRFQEAQIKTEVIELTDREQIAIIFERVNRAGMRLDTFQLLTAWTWSNEFDLNEKLDSLGSEVEPYGYAEISKEHDLLMRCCAAVINGTASIRNIVDLHGPTVRDNFDKVKRGILGAIEFLRTHLQVHSLDVMPYPAMIVSLSRFFSTDKASGIHATSKQVYHLKKWYWRSCFSRRYSSGVNRAYATDIAAMDSLRENENFDISDFPITISRDFFIDNKFNTQAVNTKVFISLLANTMPRSLISGQPISLEDVLQRCNRNEFHHIFPKAHLTGDDYADQTHSLANFCFLSSADNQIIKDKAPVVYEKLIPHELRDDVFRSALLPDKWYMLTFNDFVKERADELVRRAEVLAAKA